MGAFAHTQGVIFAMQEDMQQLRCRHVADNLLCQNAGVCQAASHAHR